MNDWRNLYFPTLVPVLVACAPLTFSAQGDVATSEIYKLPSHRAFDNLSAYSLAPPLDDTAQLQILGRFAAELIENTMEPPQAAIDAVNDRFWELV